MKLPLKELKSWISRSMSSVRVCTQMLGKLGADVIKIEPVEGDGARITASGTDSTLFLACNAGKRALPSNLKESKGIEIVFNLAKDADVMVENFRPGS